MYAFFNYKLVFKNTLCEIKTQKPFNPKLNK